MTTILPLVLLAFLGAADPLAELDAAMSKLPAPAPLSARFTHHFEEQLGTGKAASVVTGDVAGEVMVGPSGLEVRWGPEVLARARQEELRRATDPEAASPARDGMRELDALSLWGLLDATADLRTALSHAHLVEERTEPLDGAPTRVLVLRLDGPLSAKDRKYINELEVTAKLWLGADGLPVAAERVSRARGRAFLVITFENDTRESFRFVHREGRLVATRHEVDRHSRGAGERRARKTLTSLEPGARPE